MSSIQAKFSFLLKNLRVKKETIINLPPRGGMEVELNQQLAGSQQLKPETDSACRLRWTWTISTQQRQQWRQQVSSSAPVLDRGRRIEQGGTHAPVSIRIAAHCYTTSGRDAAGGPGPHAAGGPPCAVGSLAGGGARRSSGEPGAVEKFPWPSG